MIKQWIGQRKEMSGLIPAQIDWVMNDLEKAKTFIHEMPGPGITARRFARVLKSMTEPITGAN